MSSGIAGISGIEEDRKEDFQSVSLDYSKQNFSANYSRSFIQKIYPLTAPALTQENCEHTFEIGSDNDTNFIDLQSIYANVSFKVVNKDTGAAVTAATDKSVSIINNIDHSLFQSINVFINGTLVSDHGRDSPIRNYVTNLLSTSSETKKTHLHANHWIDDEGTPKISPLAADFVSPTGEKGLYERFNLIKSGGVHCYFQPQFDLMTCPRLLPAGNTLKLTFVTAHSDFLLMVPAVTEPANTKYKLEITSFNLEVQRILPNRSALRHVEDAKKSILSFPITRTTVRKVQILTGQYDVLLPRIVSPDQLPYQILIIPAENYQFDVSTKNPYVWKQNNIKKANLLLNGTSIPQEPYQFDDKNKIRAYKLIMKALGHTELTSSSCGVSINRWLKANFFIAWDLTGCCCAGIYLLLLLSLSLSHSLSLSL